MTRNIQTREAEMQTTDLQTNETLSDEAFASTLHDLSGTLDQALADGDLPAFYRAFRQTELPGLAWSLRQRPERLFQRLVETVRQLGARSPAVGLAIENHYYVTSALSTLPLSEADAMAPRRDALIESVARQRWLVANTSSRVHGDKVASTGTVAKPEGDGYRVRGRSAYTSLAGEGDLLVFITHLEGGEPAIFACPLKGNPQIEVGPLLFPNAMVDSDTRKITFQDLHCRPEHLLVSGREHHNILGILAFETSWHQCLLAALALGVAARAIDEARLFLRQVRRPDGTLLADLDGMITDVGRLAIHYQAAASSLERAGEALVRTIRQPVFDRRLSTHAFEQSCAAKYVATHCAEDTVAAVRKLIGARGFAGGQAIERLSQEGMFILLAGEVSAAIERLLGKKVLGEQPFLNDGPEPAKSGKQTAALEKLRLRAQARRQAARSSS